MNYESMKEKLLVCYSSEILSHLAPVFCCLTPLFGRRAIGNLSSGACQGERERDELNPILISEILSRGTFWNHSAGDVEMMGPWKEWMGSFAP